MKIIVKLYVEKIKVYAKGVLYVLALNAGSARLESLYVSKSTRSYLSTYRMSCMRCFISPIVTCHLMDSQMEGRLLIRCPATQFIDRWLCCSCISEIPDSW